MVVKDIASQAGCFLGNGVSMGCMRVASMETLLELASGPNSKYRFSWVPVVDGTYIQENPTSVWRDGRLPMPLKGVLSGSSIQEYWSILCWSLSSNLNPDFGLSEANVGVYLSELFGPDHSQSVKAEFSDILGSSSLTPYEQVATIVTSFAGSCALQANAQWAAGNHVGVQYQYQLQHRLSFVPQEFGASHFQTLALGWHSPCFISCGYLRGKFTPGEEDLSNSIITRFGNFITSGDPQCTDDSLPPGLTTPWVSGPDQTMVLGPDPQTITMQPMQVVNSADQCPFWSQLTADFSNLQ